MACIGFKEITHTRLLLLVSIRSAPTKTLAAPQDSCSSRRTPAATIRPNPFLRRPSQIPKHEQQRSSKTAAGFLPPATTSYSSCSCVRWVSPPLLSSSRCVRPLETIGTCFLLPAAVSGLMIITGELDISRRRLCSCRRPTPLPPCEFRRSQPLSSSFGRC